MRGVKHEFGMLFTPHGMLTRQIRAPKHQRQTRASTEKMGRIGRGKKGFDGPRAIGGARLAQADARHFVCRADLSTGLERIALAFKTFSLLVRGQGRVTARVCMPNPAYDERILQRRLSGPRARPWLFVFSTRQRRVSRGAADECEVNCAHLTARALGVGTIARATGHAKAVAWAIEQSAEKTCCLNGDMKLFV